MVSRYLRYRGYRVTYVRNITDVDDKIINRARETGVDWRAHAEKYTQAMHEDLDRLGCLRPEKEPKAADYIDEMLTMIGQLIDNGYAYQASNGDVMYDVHKFAAYGKLSGKKLEDLRAGSRVEVDTAKRDPLDFVLWKSAKHGEPAWPSPWGDGRPGWHIECSAMSTKELGEHFDIHGGGLDLKFPHHENEIAQSACAHDGAPLARFWLHNGFLDVEREKMSKSLGNVLLVGDLLREAPGEAIRYALLAAHYRKPLDWSDAGLARARQALDRLYLTLSELPGPNAPAPDAGAPEPLVAALEDDLNTPKAFAELFALARQANASTDNDERRVLKARLLASGNLLGLLQQEPEAWLKTTGRTEIDATEVERLIELRAAARQARNFAEADRIRDQLAAEGVSLEDQAGRTRWRLAG
jgi:cysteinyl-tRNA synthetase